MKNLIKLILLVFLSNSFSLIQSQTITLKEKEKVSILDSLKGNAIINVVIEGQVAKANLNEARKRIAERNKQIQLQNKMINDNKLSLANCELASVKKDSIIVNDISIIKKVKRKVSFWQVISGILSTFLIITSIK